MRKNIKILHICSVGFTVKKLLLPLIDFQRDIFDVSVICGDDYISRELIEKGYDICYVNIGRKIDLVKNIKSIIEVYKHIKKGKYDIVHAHTPLAGIIGRVAAKLAKVPIILFTVRGFYFHENMSYLKKKLFSYVEKFASKISGFIFIQSAEDYETARKNGIIPCDKMLVIGNGVNTDKFDKGKITEETRKSIKSEFKIKENDIVVGMVGRIVREKGYIELVNAANIIVSKNRNIKFVAIGDSLESEQDGIKQILDEFIEVNNIKDNFIFTGMRDDMPELMSIMDIFVLPSYREGMPRALIEAMSMSLPSVATNIRGCREEIVEGETGYLFPVGDYEKLAERVLYLIENPQKCEIMGRKARERAVENFDEGVVLRKQMSVIERVLSIL